MLLVEGRAIIVMLKLDLDLRRAWRMKGPRLPPAPTMAMFLKGVDIVILWWIWFGLIWFGVSLLSSEGSWGEVRVCFCSNIVKVVIFTVCLPVCLLSTLLGEFASLLYPSLHQSPPLTQS